MIFYIDLNMTHDVYLLVQTSYMIFYISSNVIYDVYLLIQRSYMMFHINLNIIYDLLCYILSVFMLYLIRFHIILYRISIIVVPVAPYTKNFSLDFRVGIIFITSKEYYHLLTKAGPSPS